MINKLSEFKKTNDDLIWLLGQTESDILLLESKKNKIKEKVLLSVIDQNKFADELNKKYGIGRINVETGEFISQ
jgi:hypothetical protein